MATQNLRVINAFQLGLFGGLGVLVALLIGGAVATLANVITYIFAAVFLALGLDPLVSLLERRKFPRPLAVLTVVVAVLGSIVLIVWNLVPTLITESTKFLESTPELIADISQLKFITSLDAQLGGTINNALTNAGEFLSDSANWPTMLGGVVQVGITLFTGVFGVVIIVVLTVFFLASLDNLKASLYKLVPGARETGSSRFRTRYRNRWADTLLGNFLWRA